MQRVIKRDGREVEFDKSKIVEFFGASSEIRTHASVKTNWFWKIGVMS
jgi:transcriptional regulator NrdR family protein